MYLYMRKLKYSGNEREKMNLWLGYQQRLLPNWFVPHGSINTWLSTREVFLLPLKVRNLRFQLTCTLVQWAFVIEQYPWVSQSVSQSVHKHFIHYHLNQIHDFDETRPQASYLMPNKGSSPKIHTRFQWNVTTTFITPDVPDCWRHKKIGV